MADIKTHLRELSVAVTIGLLKSKTNYIKEDLYDSSKFWDLCKKNIKNDLSGAVNITCTPKYTGELKQIIDNGFNLGNQIYKNPEFNIMKNDEIFWLGNDTQKEDPTDIRIGKYNFSLKEESFILENMGLYQLLNCYTGSNYSRGSRHIFKDYAFNEYKVWFSVTWKELLNFLSSNKDRWEFINGAKKSLIFKSNDNIELEYYKNNILISKTTLPIQCELLDFEENTTKDTREHVFSKFIYNELNENTKYIKSKMECSIVATKNLANELNKNLKYDAGLPRFLRIHSEEYYYAKTTNSNISIFKVPSIKAFGKDIIIESIKPSVPTHQANILTTIKNIKTNQELVLRNECRFSHGQFNGTPEAKLYYERGGSLELIYEKIDII